MEKAFLTLKIAILEEALEKIAPGVPDNEPGAYYDGLLTGKERLQKFTNEIKSKLLFLE